MTEYTEALQTFFLEMMIDHPDIYVRVQNIYNAENFDRSLRQAATFIKDHAANHKVMPSIEQVNAACNTKFKPVTGLSDGHYDWLLSEFEGFSKRKELERAILKSADLLEKGEYGPVEKLIKDAVQIGLVKDLGTDYFKDPRGRLMEIWSKNNLIGTGWPTLDNALYGGFNRGELNVFAGQSGCVVADTEIEIVQPIEIPKKEPGELLRMHRPQATAKVAYLQQFYSDDEIQSYNNDAKLYSKTRPKKVRIGGFVLDRPTYVSSPDGWVRVIYKRIKQKSSLRTFTFKNHSPITVSDDHLFQIPQEIWHFARDLYVGQELLTSKGKDTIQGISHAYADTTVYDLSVDHPNHRYFTNGICSHNSGKSLFMMNLAVNWSTTGLNGAYITLELLENLCSMRIDAMISNMGTREIRKNLDDVELKVKMAGKKSGAFQIKYMPAQSTANDIRSFVKELEIQSKKKLDFLAVDYLDLLMPAGVKINPSDVFTKDKFVSEELRNLAQELNVLFVTASQLNRSSIDEVEFDHSHVAGGISKIYSADNVFGIFTSRAMRERGKYQLHLMKTRSSSGVGKKVDLDFDIDSLRIVDAGETPSDPSANAANILKNIKPRAQITETIDKQTGEITSKPADQEVKLKALLAGIKANK